jgi:Ca2+-binding EF-hand superfamily protein
MASPFVHRKMALAFYRLDVSRDGLVSQADLASLGQRVVEQLGLPQDAAQAAKIGRAFIGVWDAYGAPADKDGDKAVSFDEFAEAHEAFLKTRNARAQGVRVNRALCAALDRNGDGHVDATEYAAFLEPMGASAADAQTAFQHLDRNGDGLLSCEELAADLWAYWNADDRSAPGNWFFGSF